MMPSAKNGGDNSSEGKRQQRVIRVQIEERRVLILNLLHQAQLLLVGTMKFNKM